jgi:hypothetical protein
LRELERSYPDELVVVGVHSGKYLAERMTDNIRQAALRLDVTHPVVNDRFFRTWRAYAVSAWPTVLLIDPEGYVVDTHPGEIDVDAYRPLLVKVIDEFAKRGTLKRQTVHFEPEAAAEPARPLSFPSKALTDGQRLFIADTGHNRIVVVALGKDGSPASVEAIIGRGDAELDDGDYQGAAFHHPQGIALLGDTLYVADTENHAIRAVNLKDRQVTTAAGNGEQARGSRMAGFGPNVLLSSPWDVAIHGRGLYVAMAGTHQIWRLDLATSEIRPYAGTGAEEIVDGPRTTAALAQTSGLSVNENVLYFADAESQAIRTVDLPPGNQVRTILGTGLFDFGDVDGAGDTVRLQHPQGLVWHEGLVYVADTYNNKIKTVDPQTRVAATFLGTGEAGSRDGKDPTFWEPGGVCVADGKLYVVDTNNHAIRVVDLKSKETTTLQIEGLEPS